MFLHTPNLNNLKDKTLFPDILLQPTKSNLPNEQSFSSAGKNSGF